MFISIYIDKGIIIVHFYIKTARDTLDFQGTASKISVRVHAVLPYRKYAITNAALKRNEYAS